MSYLEIKNLSKSFNKTEVLKDISLTVEKGEVVSVIGSSGSGKTTLLRCVNFLEKPDKGQMILDGVTLIDKSPSDKKEKAESERELREKRLNFGLVFQSFNLFPQYNVFDNVTLAPTLLLKDKLKEYKKRLITESKTDKSLTRKVVKEKLLEFKTNEKEKIKSEADELIDKIGMSDKKNSFPCELSGGQCQRVAIARALALKPAVLCFDEPTSALDPELTGEVLKVIKSLKDENRTMIIVTHEMGFAKNVSDKIVFMANGIIEEEGSPSDIFDNPESELLKSFISGVTNKDGD